MSSGKCGNCDCSDQSQCGAKNGYYVDVVETETVVMMDAPAATEGGACKCGTGCACGSSCSCNGCGCCN
uniref:Metallothionein 3 n=1 Tax=Plantago major TaxID=29818 RepID=Q5ZF74_PLAMJ|nr:metallothionein 3 [Plantago major]